MQAVEQVPFVGGDVALDFVNTAELRGHPAAGDALAGPADLRRWGQRYGLLASARSGRDDAAELRRAVPARELLYRLLRDRAAGRPLPAGGVAELGELAARAYRAGRLTAGPSGRLGWQWSRTEVATVRHVAVTSAIALLSADPPPRVKQCPGDGCGWLFLDTTKRGNRRWCLMSECGQLAKDDRRRARRAGS